MREATVVTLLVLITLVLAAPLMAQTRPGARYPWSTRSEVFAPHHMAATSQPLATEAALEILAAGGNAVDAAIAANAVLALTEPTGCGLGGDLFAMVWDNEARRLHGLDASGRSPRALTAEVFAKAGLTRVPSYGPLPITVPGCVDGWFTLHARFGALPMARVLAPAIARAREGFPVTEVIALLWAAGHRKLAEYPGFAAVFLPGGRAPTKGELFRNPALARTLESLAQHGRAAFYGGELGERLCAFVQEHGGYLAIDDLTAHRSDWIEPVSTNYRGFDVWELPPAGQGIAALQMLNILEGYDLRAAGFGSVEHLHLLTEAKKLAFEDRARFYADRDHMDVTVEKLIAKPYAAERRKRIDRERAALSQTPGNPALGHGDTIYLTTADGDGNMVSLIQSNFRGFGSGIAPPELGFCLQDRGELFDLTPGRPNSYAPGKRPFHTIIPAFLSKDGLPWLSFGVMGGDMQPQGHVQIVLDLIDFGMNLQEAGDAPRLLHGGSSSPVGEVMSDGGTLALEPGFAPEVIEALRARGHRVEVRAGDVGFGGYQAIGIGPAGGYVGASESRKDGMAAGR